MRTALAYLIFVLLSASGLAQLDSVYHEVFYTDDGSISGYPTGHTTYRIYADLADGEDAISVVYATLDGYNLFLGTSGDGIWNADLGGVVGPDLNDVIFPAFPETAYDSFVTIGRASLADPGADVFAFSAAPSDESFDQSFLSLPYGENLALLDGGWSTIPEGENAQGQGPDFTVLLAQITTNGALSYSLNIQMIDGGVGGDEIRYVNGPALEENEIDGSELGLVFPPGDCCDETACNYTTDAEECNDILCEFTSCAGCTNSEAPNYDPTATIDDGSCQVYGCTDPYGCNYDPDAVDDEYYTTQECTYDCYGCMDPSACNYYHYATRPADCFTNCEGCMDPEAQNYAENANLTATCAYGYQAILEPFITHSGTYADGVNLDGYTTYRLYLEGPSAEDQLRQIQSSYSLANWQWIAQGYMQFLTTGDFFQSEWGGPFSDDVHSDDFDAYPSLAYDSFLTIEQEFDNGLGSSSSLIPPVLSSFEQGSDLIDEVGVGWYRSGAIPGEPFGEDLKILVGQFTTNGEVSYCFNAEIMHDGGVVIVNFCGGAEPPGCGNADACNYDPEVVLNDVSLCDYSCSGCMDETACNYDAEATLDNGICFYGYDLEISYTLIDPTPSPHGLTILDANANQVFSTSGWPYNTSGTFHFTACLPSGCYRLVTGGPFPDEDREICVLIMHDEVEILNTSNNDVLFSIFDDDCSYACNDIAACNYVGGYTDEDCYYDCSGCTDPTSCNYDPFAYEDDGSCTTTCPGCTDALAANYDPQATEDSGGCYYFGCTDPLASNYNPDAAFDDGSCEGNQAGCTDTLACNYSEEADVDDGSCCYAHCVTIISPACRDYSVWDVAQEQFNPSSSKGNESVFCLEEGCYLYLVDVPWPYDDDYHVGMPVTVITNGDTLDVVLNEDSFFTFGAGEVDCIYGCEDPEACNYVEGANYPAFCNYTSCIGCSNPDACNYEEIYTIDDGSCCLDNCVVVTSPGVWGPGAGFLISSDPEPTAENAEFSGAFTGITPNFCIPDGCYYMLAQSSEGEWLADLNVWVNGEQFVIAASETPQLVVFGESDCGAGCMDPLAYNYDPEATIDYNCIYAGCTNDTASNYDPQSSVDDGSCLYQLHGYVFHDDETNGDFDAFEAGIPGYEVTLQPDNITATTDGDGYFDFGSLLPGDYAVSLDTTGSAFTEVTTSISQEIEVGLDETLLYFGLEDDAPELHLDLSFYSESFGYPCIQDTINHNICFSNEGTVVMNGYVRLDYDPLFLSYVEETPIDSVVDGSVYLGFENLLPGELFAYNIGLVTPGLDFLGEYLNSSVLVVGENETYSLTAEKQKSINMLISCAYDPNDKTGYPVGYAEPHFILGDQELDYLIRFQNTGNDTADVVVIRDTLSAVLDFDSFELLTYSHNVMTTLDNNSGAVEFRFENILLPDSNVNEPESHGFVSYVVRPLEGLAHGTQIHNTAHIFFDDNPAIVTNTTSHSIFVCDEDFLTLEPDQISLCPGDSALIAASGEYLEDITWSAGTEAESYWFYAIESGVFDIQVSGSNPLCQDTDEVSVEVFDFPEIVIESGLNWLLTTQGDSWQWYVDGEVIEGATSNTLEFTEDGDYQVEVFTEDGCQGISEVFEGVYVGVEEEHFDVRVYPNPAHDGFYLETEIKISGLELRDTSGRLILQESPRTSGTVWISLAGISTGAYTLILDGGTYFQKRLPLIVR